MSTGLPSCAKLLIIRADIHSAADVLSRLLRDPSGLCVNEIRALHELAHRYTRTCDVLRNVYEHVPSEHMDYVHCLCFHLLHDLVYLQHTRTCPDRAQQYRDEIDAQQVPRVLLYERACHPGCVEAIE